MFFTNNPEDLSPMDTDVLNAMFEVWEADVYRVARERQLRREGLRDDCDKELNARVGRVRLTTPSSFPGHPLSGTQPAA